MSASYVKLHKTVTDFSSGFQTVNQLYNNLQEVADAFALEHSPLETVVGRGGVISPAPLSQAFGRHNTPKVPRAVVRTTLFTSSFSVLLPGAIVVQPVVTGVARISAGLFFIGITELLEFYAECEPDQSSASPQRLILPRTIFGGGGAQIGISIECYEKAGIGGDFDPTDFDFSAHIYGTNL